MHIYPASRIWLVAIVMLIALLLALPNVFGEAPAVQLSRNDRAKATDADLSAVKATLEAKGIAIDESHLEGDRLVLRFDNVEEQLRARDVIQASHGQQYLVALSQVPRTPGWMRASIGGGPPRTSSITARESAPVYGGWPLRVS